MAESVDVKVDGNKSKPKMKKPKFNWKVFLVIVVIVASLGAAFYFWNDAQNAKSSTPEAVAAKNQEESARVISALDLVLYTESDGEPTVARIEDPAILKQSNPDFYNNAQAGDYLILYPNRAIIFRESENRVINVAPIINTSEITPEQ